MRLDLMTNIWKPIHDYLKSDALPLFLVITHPFSRYGSQTTLDLIRDFDWYVSEIHDFVRPTDNEQCKLKSWRHVLEFSEVYGHLCRHCRAEMKLICDDYWFCNNHMDLSNED